MTHQPPRRNKPATVFATLVVSGAILLTAWHGNTDWMALGLLLIFASPNFRRTAMRFLKAEKGQFDDKCTPPEA